MLDRAAWIFVGALAVALPGWGCGQSVVGQPCSASDPCPANFDCAPDRTGELRCAYVCEFGVDTICVDGSVCLPIGSMGDACYAGGTAGIGGDCSSHLDCVRGAICLQVTGATISPRCYRGCNYGETNTCPGSAYCSPASGGSGYCP